MQLDLPLLMLELIALTLVAAVAFLFVQHGVLYLAMIRRQYTSGHDLGRKRPP